jgi:hypothetical protein
MPLGDHLSGWLVMGRCDSLGFSAKYCTYTIMELGTSRILTFVLGQVRQGQSSVALEVDGCNEALSELKDCGVNCEMLGTDSNMSVAKMMRADVVHQYDLYHIEKRIVKKLHAKAKVSPYPFSFSIHDIKIFKFLTFYQIFCFLSLLKIYVNFLHINRSEEMRSWLSGSIQCAIICGGARKIVTTIQWSYESAGSHPPQRQSSFLAKLHQVPAMCSRTSHAGETQKEVAETQQPCSCSTQRCCP